MQPNNLRPPEMAVAVDHHRLSPFKAPARHRRTRLRSFPQLDLSQSEPSAPSTFRSLKPSHVPAPTSFHRSLSTPCLFSDRSDVVDFPDAGTRMEVVMGKRGPGVDVLLVEAALAMAGGKRPVPVPCGVGGVYYLLNRSGENLAVLKPANDEPMGLALGQPGTRRSISVGETGVREVAAYLLDHGGFSSVPPTALVKISDAAFQLTTPPSTPCHRIASVQRFVPHNFDAGDLGPSRFSVSSVHRIGILDVRLLNTDRHSGNILVRSCISGVEDWKDVAELVPIDHGLCLPELLDDPYFEWLHWPQATVPFSDVELEYVSSLVPSKDAQLLRAELPLLQEASIRVLVLCTTFLKYAAAAGLCLADIGDMMTRRLSAADGGSSSTLEDMCRQVGQSMSRVDLETEVAVSDDAHGRGSPDHYDVVEVVEHEGNCVDIPTLLHALPPKPLPTKSLLFRSMSSEAMLPSSAEEEDHRNNFDDKRIVSEGQEEKDDRDGVGFVVSDASRQGKGLSFRDMTEEEWRGFLERFEAVLPVVLEERKKRLGGPCRF